jgi:hypothetical protein
VTAAIVCRADVEMALETRLAGDSDLFGFVERDRICCEAGRDGIG